MSGYDPNNIFAKILRGEIPSHKVYEDEDTIAFLDIMPRADGHTLIVPKTACRNLLDCPADVLEKTIKVAQKIAHATMKAFAAEGITLQQFSESAGGQEVFHLHFHVIPRHEDVPLRERKMADQELLRQNAEKIRAVLAS